MGRPTIAHWVLFDLTGLCPQLQFCKEDDNPKTHEGGIRTPIQVASKKKKKKRTPIQVMHVYRQLVQ